MVFEESFLGGQNLAEPGGTSPDSAAPGAARSAVETRGFERFLAPLSNQQSPDARKRSGGDGHRLALRADA